MNLFVSAVIAVCMLVHDATCETNAIAWCYHEPECNATTWATIAPEHCNGSRQSPIDIVSTSVLENANLTEFTFEGFENTFNMTKIENTGKTVKVTLAEGIKVSGGDLSEAYDSLQFHLHWGNGTTQPGSEHRVNGKQYPMELHIVNSKSSFKRNTTLAVKDSTGLAALGFLIEELPNSSGEPASWKSLTSYLANISTANSESAMQVNFSLNDLLVGVNRTNYYRYLGSLTTPTCDEAVVWTVFKEPIKVSKDLIDLFSTTLFVSNSSTTLMVNVFRNLQPTQQVYTQPAVSTQAPSSDASSVLSSCSTVSFSVALSALYTFLVKRW